MSDNPITARTFMQHKHLDPNQYTLSLLQEGLRSGLIRREEFDHVQGQIMILLAESIVRYTGGESSSLRTETAERLMLSILYALDASLKAIGTPEHAAAFLISGSIREAYLNGLELLEVAFADASYLYRQIEPNRLGIPNQAYHMTIDELAKFFKGYDKRFNARDTIASIDYPLLFDDMKVQGVYYIKQYLERLNLETEFCRFFPSREIKHLLYNYERICRIDYRESLINIFEIVLNNALFSIMAGSPAGTLGISRRRCLHLQNRLAPLDNGQRSALVRASLEILFRQLPVENSELQIYIQRYRSLLLPRLQNALSNSCLDHLLIVDEQGTKPQTYNLNEGRSMNDEEFRNLLEAVRGCPDTREKIELITSRLESLSDFIDLLEAEFLYGDEYRALYSSLGDLELSVLAGIVFMEEIRSGHGVFSLQNYKEINGDMEWQLEYKRFLGTLDSQRLSVIQKQLKRK